MQIKEYTTVDKSAWARGPWDGEPDKRQWPDPDTGLPCLAVRGPAGAWCGYVGVMPGHPWHGKDYDACVSPELHDDHESDDKGWHYNCTPSGILRAHGGLTFASGCSELTRERWEQWRANIEGRENEARQYPRGSVARIMQERATELESFEAWHEYGRATFICHLPEPGEPDNVWWFGFDCAHSGDLAPKYDGLGGHHFGDDMYRDLAYVEREVTSLAKQLAAVPTT